LGEATPSDADLASCKPKQP